MENIKRPQPPQLVGKGFKPGNNANPNGRPVGRTIRERVREWLDTHPEDMEAFVKHFTGKNRELAWQMLEGSPKSTSEVKSESVHIEISGADLLLAKELEQRRQIQGGSA